MHATCPDCSWTNEADDRRDAHHAAQAHWEARHAPRWCGFCSPTQGPLALRADHETCTIAAIESWAEAGEGSSE